MSEDNKTLQVSDVDFASIKENLKKFLQDQDEFSDYNFEGSALSVLMDILSYNTHYNAMHTNLAFNEAFLKSAQQRGSVAMRAGELGYLPGSRAAARAVVGLTFSVSTNPASYVIPKNTKFVARSGNTSFTFVNPHDCLVDRNDAGLYSKNIELYQGVFSEYAYIVDSADLSQRFIIPSRNVDLRTLTVVRKNSATSSNFEVFYPITNWEIGEIDETTPGFFVEETHDGYYRVFFGDGVIGKKPADGNQIILSYLITDGATANNVRSFTLSSSLSNVSGMTVTTLEAASGGAERESIESIKRLAPMWYEAQRRAVTENDFRVLIRRLYPSIADVAVWGGERNDPPYYGKVFIAVKPANATEFSNYYKQQITRDFVNRYNVMSIRPEIVDPDYIFVSVSTSITYDARQLFSSSTSDLQTVVKNAILNFMSTETNKFGAPLYYSKLVAAIDNSSPLIINSVTNLTLEKYEEIIPGVPTKYSFSFNNAIHPGTVRSNPFMIDGVQWLIKDRPGGPGPHNVGTIVVYRLSNDGSQITYSNNAGTVDYNSGLIVLNDLKVDSIVGDAFYKRIRILVSPGSFANLNSPETVYTDYNVYTNDRDQIISLKDNSAVSVTMVPGTR